METYNNRLCATYDDLVGIMSVRAVQCSAQRGKIEQVRRACKDTPALFAVDSLPMKYQTEIYRRNPDMKERAESKQFVDTIEPDGAAINFYETYRLPDGRCLPPEKVAEYSNNAAILNGYRTVLERANSQRKRQSRPSINKTIFWKQAAASLGHLADRYPNTLPENARRLQEKFNLYLRGGYETLVTGRYGLKNAAKVSSDEQESVIVRLLSDYRNFNDEEVARMYNFMAGKLGWKEVTGAAVGVWRSKTELITAAGRLGASNFHNVKAMQNRRYKPTAPLLFWTMDGWDVELYYQATQTDKKGHKVTTYSNRLCMVLVLDPCEMYPIGYAVGTHENPELIKAALRDAANHTAQLFGQRYRCNQLQSDHYAFKALSPLYSVMSDKVTPARVKNAKSKIVEPFFNHLNMTYFRNNKNWSGFGITSDKFKQPNSDALNFHRHEFPDAEGCIRQICGYMELDRAKKREAYLAHFADLAEERKLPLTEEQYLLNFGNDTGFRNAIEGRGLCPTIEGVKRVYDTFDMNFRKYQHVRWAVKYDPQNLDRVLAVSEDGMHRFMLEDKYTQPMALADRKEGDAEQLARVNDFNKQLQAHVIDSLAIASTTCQKLIDGNSALDHTLVKAILCDSNGQHKDRRNDRRALAAAINTVEVKPVQAAPSTEVGFDEETNIYDLL